MHQIEQKLFQMLFLLVITLWKYVIQVKTVIATTEKKKEENRTTVIASFLKCFDFIFENFQWICQVCRCERDTSETCKESNLFFH